MSGRIPVRMDMTPMVDVAFLLLIFFMSTTQFKPPEVIAVNLPASTAEMRVPETGTIIFTVNRDGRYFVSTESARDIQEIEKAQLFNAIVAWRTQNPSAVIIVKGDRDVTFSQVSELMNKLAEAKAVRFNLMTDVKGSMKAESGKERGNG
jgi:biopolymer transport protein ExbD